MRDDKAANGRRLPWRPSSPKPRLSQRGHDCADLQSLQRFQLRFGGIAALLRC